MCTTSNALRERECCPNVTDDNGRSSKCGYHIGRGRCEDIEFPKYEFDPKLTFELIFDDRKDWPRAFFDKACKCNRNFGGVDCMQCKPGYQGSQCTKKKNIVIRRNILSFSESETDELVQNLDKSKFVSSEEYVILTTSYDKILLGEQPSFSNISMYDLFVWMHYYASRSNLVLDTNDLGSNSKAFIDIFTQSRLDRTRLQLSGDRDYAHAGPAFLPWHRYFMLKWESEFVANIVKEPDFAIPYWDWRQTNTCDVCTDRLFGAKNLSLPQFIRNASVFSAWKTICTKTGEDDYQLVGMQCDGTPEAPLLRNYGEYDDALSSGLPSSADVWTSLRFSRYETPPFNKSSNGSFRNIMEGFAQPSSGRALPQFSTMHNAVHLFMNGTMSDVGSSANDPLFILHHAFVDGIYEEWLHRYSLESILLDLNIREEEIPVGHNLRDFMVPFLPLVRQIEGFLPSRELGYSYDFIEDAVGSGMIDSDSKERDLMDLVQRDIVPFDLPEQDETAVAGHFEALIDRPQLDEQNEVTTGRSFLIHKLGIHENYRHQSLRSREQLVEGDFANSKFTPEPSTETTIKNSDIGGEMGSNWDRFVWSLYDGERYFASLSVKERILLLSMMVVAIVCVIIWIVICCKCWHQLRTRLRRTPSKGEA